MSKEDIKLEINKVLDNFSDKALEELLSFLRELDKRHQPLYTQQSLQQLFEEDDELLKKLAQ